MQQLLYNKSNKHHPKEKGHVETSLFFCKVSLCPPWRAYSRVQLRPVPSQGVCVPKGMIQYLVFAVKKNSVL